MANNFMQSLLSLIGTAPAPANVIDTRTREGVSVDQQRAGMASQLNSQYNQAMQDPNAGIGTPEQQALQEQQLQHDVLSRMSGAGGDQSGTSNDEVRKAIVDYRIGALGKRQQYLDSLRQAMIGASAPMPGGTQDSVSQSPFRTAVGAAVGGFGARAGQAASDNVFGKPGGNNPTGTNANGQVTGGGTPGDPAHGFRVADPNNVMGV